MARGWEKNFQKLLHIKFREGLILFHSCYLSYRIIKVVMYGFLPVGFLAFDVTLVTGLFKLLHERPCCIVFVQRGDN